MSIWNPKHIKRQANDTRGIKLSVRSIDTDENSIAAGISWKPTGHSSQKSSFIPIHVGDHLQQPLPPLCTHLWYHADLCLQPCFPFILLSQLPNPEGILWEPISQACQRSKESSEAVKMEVRILDVEDTIKEIDTPVKENLKSEKLLTQNI